MKHSGYEPEWRPARGAGVHVDGRGVSAAFSVVVLLLVSLILRPPLWVTVLVAAMLAILMLGLSWLAGQQREAFDRGFLRLVQVGEGHSIRRMMRRYPLARWWSPPVDFQTKVGLVAASMGDDEEAERALEKAWVHAGGARRRALVGPLCRVKFRRGSWDDTLELAGDWMKVEGDEGPAAWYRAAALREHGVLSQERLEELALQAGPTREPTDEQAQLHAVQGAPADVADARRG